MNVMERAGERKRGKEVGERERMEREKEEEHDVTSGSEGGDRRERGKEREQAC